MEVLIIQIVPGNSRKAPTERRLQHVSVPLTGSYWLDVQRVDQPPEIVGVVAAIQTQA